METGMCSLRKALRNGSCSNWPFALIAAPLLYPGELLYFISNGPATPLVRLTCVLHKGFVRFEIVDAAACREVQTHRRTHVRDTADSCRANDPTDCRV